ncbi:hypothetical protein CEAn_00034 [Coxiella endosymbiont of Amblyomma nuttalli]|nr:hypothetical protein CEAn_00034 [Coxiella endosymbiont of Amblyomma nuttalli]
MVTTIAPYSLHTYLLVTHYLVVTTEKRIQSEECVNKVFTSVKSSIRVI